MMAVHQLPLLGRATLFAMTSVTLPSALRLSLLKRTPHPSSAKPAARSSVPSLARSATCRTYLCAWMAAPGSAAPLTLICGRIPSMAFVMNAVTLKLALSRLERIEQSIVIIMSGIADALNLNEWVELTKRIL